VVNHYNALGLSQAASADEIKKAHRKLVRQFHPDLNKSDKDTETKFKEVQEAYDVLSDETKKRDYDRKLTSKGSPSASDIFSEPRWNNGEIPTNGQDIPLPIHMTLEESFSGGVKVVEYHREVNCESCRGNGLKSGKTRQLCPSCKGSGKVVMVGINGRFQIRQLCPTCRGKGGVVDPKDACGGCNGFGRTKRLETVNVRFPRGVSSNDHTIIEGMGDAGTLGGGFGSVVCVFLVAQHSRFERAGTDLITELPVSFIQLALGDEFEIDTIEGKKVKLTVREETPNARVFRIAGFGMPALHSDQRGNLLVRVVADTLTGLTAKQKKLLREVQYLEDEKP
jgi:molecular chaperone DnaJ